MGKQYSIRLNMNMRFHKLTCVNRQPGPASTVGDRPPTNPAIRVRFSVVDEFFFRVRGRHLYATPINSNYSLQRKTINAIYWISRKRSLHSLAVRKGTYLQIGPMGRSFKRWASNHTTLLRNSTNYSSNLRRYPTRYKAYG